MDAASIEQMNKVRVSLGMAPLPVPGAAGPQFKQAVANNSDSEESDDLSTLDKRQAAAGGNWQKLENERQAQVERQKRKDAAKRARDIAQKYFKLEGKGLGDADEKEVDTKTWLLEQKKRQKKIEKARKLEQELAARELQAEYTAKDLAGVKVAHEVDEFDEGGGEQVLTLKDAAIGEESEDDELENQDLRAREKLQEKLELQKKKPVYNPNDVDEKKGVLAQYDDEIDGKKQKRFTLDGQGNTVEATKTVGEDDTGKKRVKISLDLFKDDTPANDYLDPSTVKVKKPKKKKAKSTRQKAVDEDDVFPIVEEQQAPKRESNEMEVDGAQTGVSSRKRALEFDDEDLQANLAQQRRQALKKRKKTDAAELARQMREEASATPMETNEDEDEEGPGLVIDETSEFVANLQRPTAPDLRQASSAPPPTAESPDEDGDTAMAEESYAAVEDDEDRKARETRETGTAANIGATGLEEEDSMGGGMANTLALLRGRGLIANNAADQNAKDRQRTKFLADKKGLIEEYDHKAREQRERDRNSGRLDKMSVRERDTYARQQNEARERYLSQLQAEMFNRDYKPNVNLKYTDEHGRNLTAKEAFKELSHQFHGKGSGKQKTEKHLRKIEDEKRREAKGVLDASNEGGMSGALASTGRKQRQAGVRLQ